MKSSWAEFMKLAKEGARLGREYAAKLKIRCAVDGCEQRPFGHGQYPDHCFDHGVEARRADAVKRNGGYHNRESYRLNKIRHQSARGMVRFR